MTAEQSGGCFVWYDLMTPDKDAAIRFYSDLVGWGTTEWEGPFDYTMWTAGGAPLGGIVVMGEAEKEMNMPPAWLYYISVPDLDGAIDTVKAHGGQVVNGPMDVPGGDRIVQCTDPQGTFFALHWSSGSQAG